MTMEQMTEKRLAKNHVTFNFWGDMSIALMNGKPSLARQGFWIFWWFFPENKNMTFLNIKNLEVSLGRPGYTWIQSWRHPISTSQIWKERMCPYTLPGEYRKSKRIQTPDTTLLGTTTNGSCTSHVIWSNAPSRAFQWSTPFMWRMASKLEMFWRRSWLKAGRSFLWSQLTWAFSVPEWSMAPRRRRDIQGFDECILGGGNSNMFQISPRKLGKVDWIWRIFFQWVGSTTN